jgi:thioredoxin 1
MRFMSLTIAHATLAGAILLAAAGSASAFETKAYDDAGFKSAQAAGKAVVVHVTAPWCPTCKAQDKVIDGMAVNPSYSTLTLFKVDFDSQKAALRAFKVNSQSTLIAFNGATETGRLVGETNAAPIGKVFDAAMKK